MTPSSETNAIAMIFLTLPPLDCVVPVEPAHVPKIAAARLFRCSLRVRVEKKLAHLAGHIAGDGTLLRPCQRLVDISAFQYPKSAHVLLGLGVRPVGDEHL